MIGAAPFGTFIQREDCDIFMTSLHEIERELEDRAEMEEQLEDLPSQYHEFANVFSKDTSDSLPPS